MEGLHEMTSRATRLSNTFVVLADTLVDDFDLTDLLYTLTTSCVDLLDVAAAGIVMAGPDDVLRVVGASDEQMRMLELLEVQNEQGPCLDCHRTGEPVQEPDLRASDRWPKFTEHALAGGFLAVEAVPLRLRSTRLGALNLFRREAGNLDEEGRAIAQALADVAAIGLLQERALRESELLAQQLQHALNSRIVIEQAKGVLAEQGRIAVEEAFEALRSYARSHATAINEVARAVTDGRLSHADLA